MTGDEGGMKPPPPDRAGSPSLYPGYKAGGMIHVRAGRGDIVLTAECAVSTRPSMTGLAVGARGGGAHLQGGESTLPHGVKGGWWSAAVAPFGAA